MGKESSKFAHQLNFTLKEIDIKEQVIVAAKT